MVAGSDEVAPWQAEVLYSVASIAHSWWTMNKASQAVFTRLAGDGYADVTSHSKRGCVPEDAHVNHSGQADTTGTQPAVIIMPMHGIVVSVGSLQAKYLPTCILTFHTT